MIPYCCYTTRPRGSRSWRAERNNKGITEDRNKKDKTIVRDGHSTKLP
jgi:hypothetical protein